MCPMPVLFRLIFTKVYRTDFFLLSIKVFVNTMFSQWLSSSQALASSFTSVSHRGLHFCWGDSEVRIHASDSLTQWKFIGLQIIRQNQSFIQGFAVALLIRGQFLWQGSELSVEAVFSADMSTSRLYKMDVMTGVCDKNEIKLTGTTWNCSI